MILRIPDDTEKKVSKALFANDYMLLRQSCIAERIRPRKSGGKPTFPTSSLFQVERQSQRKGIQPGGDA
jgi:hypothetical protein